MQFEFVSRLYRHPDDEISLRDVWTISAGELCAAADIAWKHLQDNAELAAMHRRVAWLSQALIEFADLADLTPIKNGRMQRKNYLYFEAISALREATIGILNGSPRASTGLLRSVLEMLLLHCWWQERMTRTETSDPFYDWLEGRGKKPRFREVIRNNVKSLEIPGETDAVAQADEIYERLCSYVHAPLLSESMTVMDGGNVRHVGVPVLSQWFQLAENTLRIALENFVHLKPQCLFPVDIPRKFGFSPLAGMYFDEFNFIPLTAVFGEVQIGEYRARLETRESVRNIMDIYDSFPDLTTGQILERWDETYSREFGDDVPDNVKSRWFLVKSKMRVLSMTLSYSKPLGPHW